LHEYVRQVPKKLRDMLIVRKVTEIARRPVTHPIPRNAISSADVMTFLYREYLAYALFLEAWANAADDSDQSASQVSGSRYRAAAYAARVRAAELRYGLRNVPGVDILPSLLTNAPAF
jgi:hypothetical protein